MLGEKENPWCEPKISAQHFHTNAPLPFGQPKFRLKIPDRTSFIVLFRVTISILCMFMEIYSKYVIKVLFVNKKCSSLLVRLILSSKYLKHNVFYGSILRPPSAFFWQILWEIYSKYLLNIILIHKNKGDICC